MSQARAPRRASFVSFFLTAVLALLAGCSDGDLFTPSGRGAARLSLRPEMSALSASLSAAEINLVRLTVTQVPSGTRILQESFPVDPTATEWPIPLELPPNIEVEVLVELINNGPFGQVVEYSGILGPFSVTAGEQPPLPAVQVFPGPPENLGITNITITGGNQQLLEGAQLTLNAQIAPGGTGVLTWVSRNAAVATVDANGVVRAVAPGTARIVVAGGARADSITVTVGARVTGVQVTPALAAVTAIGADATFTAKAVDARGAEVTGQTFTWTIEDPTVATMVSPGVFRSLRNGETGITATVTQAGQTFTSNRVVLRVTQAVATVTVSPTSHNFSALGQTQQFTAEAKDARGNVMSLPVTWNSTNPAAATVSNGGLVTAVANGATTIEATIGGIKATAAVTVQQVATNFAVTPDTATLIFAGQSITLLAAMRDAEGNPVSTPLVAWTSSNPSVATVDQNGVVTAQNNGVTTIRAVSGTFSDASIITVQRKTHQLLLQAKTDSVTVGQTFTFTAIAIDLGGTVITGKPITWASSDTSIARINPATGVVTGVRSGTVTITATADDVIVSHTLTVRAATGFQPGNGRVLLYHRESSFDAHDVKDRLVATGLFHADSIDVMEMLSTPLPLTTLAQYGSIFVWTDNAPDNPVGVGDRLKEYVDLGGKVLLAVYALGVPNRPWELQGGIMGPGYNPLRLPYETQQQIDGQRHLNFQTALLSHPIMQGVTAFSFCANSNYARVTLDPGATLVASDTQGVPLIGVSANGRVVAFNLWPLYEYHCTTSSAQYIDRALANALR